MHEQGCVSQIELEICTFADQEEEMARVKPCGKKGLERAHTLRVRKRGFITMRGERNAAGIKLVSSSPLTPLIKFERALRLNRLHQLKRRRRKAGERASEWERCFWQSAGGRQKDGWETTFKIFDLLANAAFYFCRYVSKCARAKSEQIVWAWKIFTNPPQRLLIVRTHKAAHGR